MLFTTTEELKQHLSTLHQNLRWETILSHVEQAETTHLAPYVTQELIDELSQPTADLSPVQVALRKRLRDAAAHYIVLDAAPFLAISAGDVGMMEQRTDQATGARQWVYNNFVDAAADNGDRLLDAALVWLEFKADDFPTWNDSDLARASRELLLQNAHEVSRFVGIQESRRTFGALLPYLRQVEDLEIRPLLGDELTDELKAALAARQLSAEQKQLLEQLRPALAHRAYAVALPFLSISVTGRGIRLLSDNDGIRQRLAAPEKVVASLASAADQVATQYLERLKRHVDGGRPDAEPWAVTQHSNADRKSFRVR
ncbi:hypothetical protein GCM10027048_20470 [Hymenobacter coalescens]